MPTILDQPVVPGGTTIAAIAPLALIVIGASFFLGTGRWRGSSEPKQNPSRRR